jgi:hypothetical protein
MVRFSTICLYVCVSSALTCASAYASCLLCCPLRQGRSRFRVRPCEVSLPIVQAVALSSPFPPDPLPGFNSITAIENRITVQVIYLQIRQCKGHSLSCILPFNILPWTCLPSLARPAVGKVSRHPVCLEVAPMLLFLALRLRTLLSGRNLKHGGTPSSGEQGPYHTATCATNTDLDSKFRLRTCRLETLPGGPVSPQCIVYPNISA